MHSVELDKLLEEFKDDVYMKIKIENIISLCSSRNPDDARFANELSVEFCRLIDLIKERYENEINFMSYEYDTKLNELESNTSKFMACKKEERPFANSIILEDAFFRYFMENGYSELTIKDYFARVKTFSKKYLNEIYPEKEIPSNPEERVLFVYDNIEYIIAKFDVKEEKQRFNIRSALRKLNDFKCVEESNR